ncbi:MAG: c-type cytochrome [Rhodoferax sp.]
MNLRGKIYPGLVSVALAASALWAPAASAATLRICSDPDNLPFSKSDGSEHGLYIDLANLLAKKLDAQPEYIWWVSLYQGKALRYTLRARKCDAYFALPAEADYETPGLLRTKGFLEVSYAVVASPSFTFTKLADLKGKRVGVQFDTTPQIILATEGGYDTTTYRTPEEMFAALDKGEVDVAMMWGPIAGYENKLHEGSRWRVTPVSGDHMSGQVAVAVRASDTALLAQLNTALTQLQPEIAKLAEKYGFPVGKPIAVAVASGSMRQGAFGVASNSRRGANVPTSAIHPVGYVTPTGTQIALASTGGSGSKLNADAVAGREFFNSTCAHCHSPDGASPIRARDLRRLKGLFGDKWPEVAKTTIENGRPDLGMPTWKGILTDQQIKQILAFLATIQSDD